MFEITANFSEVLGILLFIVWTNAGYRAGRLVFRRTQNKLHRGALGSLVRLGFGLFFLLVQLILVVMLWWGVDWNFASNRIVLALPVTIVPAVAVATLSIPRLWQLVRKKPHESKAFLSTAERSAASDPLLVVPIQAAAIGSFLNFWAVFIQRPNPPYTAIFFVFWAILLGGTALLWLRQRRRHLLLSQPEAIEGGGFIIRSLRTIGLLAVIGIVGFVFISNGLSASRLPDHLNMTTMKNVDWGGGPIGMEPGRAMTGHQMGKSVADLTGPVGGTPDVKFTLTAEPKQIRLSSGKMVDGWVFNGQAPGPELRMHEGDLVEVTLINKLPKEGVTIHWHGLDVPGAEDGVAGVTQDAVQPGQSFTYRFRPKQVGTFWYHSHQASEQAVDRGLFGPLVVLPKEKTAAPGLDIPILVHSWKTDIPSSAQTDQWGGGHDNAAMGISDNLERKAVTQGTPVRLRLINTSDNTTEDAIPRQFTLSGTSFKVTAIDGTGLNNPGDLTNVRLEMAEGGRYDLTFIMPNHPVRLSDLTNSSGGLLLSPDGKGDMANTVPIDAPVFNPAAYGTPAPTPFNGASQFDRQFTLYLDDRFAFYDGSFFPRPVVNGHVFPDTPMLMVKEGDLVKTTFINRGHLDHPMHLHGHHALVLSRSGKPTTGSPWWTDTLNVKPGEIFEIAFRADNPGIWMDHCHNLQHAAQGMVLHLAYDGITTPFEIGHGTINRPE